jgi:hypothetical protein
MFIAMTGLVSLACAQAAVKDPSANTEVKQQADPYANAKIIAKIIPSANNTFGHDIFVYGKPLVHQIDICGYVETISI